MARVKVEWVFCDQCKRNEQIDEWTGVEVIDPGCPQRILQFCSYSCLITWAEKMKASFEGKA